MGVDEGLLADLVARRQIAEKAVEGMPEGTTRERAFEVMLRWLLDSLPPGGTKRKSGKRSAKQTRPTPVNEQTGTRAQPAAGAQTHIRQLVDDGYFDEGRTLPQLADELELRGYRYEQQQLSPLVLELTRNRVLQRSRRETEGGRRMYVYRKPAD